MTTCHESKKDPLGLCGLFMIGWFYVDYSWLVHIVTFEIQYHLNIWTKQED